MSAPLPSAPAFAPQPTSVTCKRMVVGHVHPLVILDEVAQCESKVSLRDVKVGLKFDNFTDHCIMGSGNKSMTSLTLGLSVEDFGSVSYF